MMYINNLPLTNFRDVKIEEELNGSLTLSFVSFNYDNPAHALLNEKEIVYVEDYEFRIEQINETQYAKEVIAVSTLFDLAGIYTHKIYGGTRKVSEFLTFLFEGTEWNFKLTTTDFRVMIPNFGMDNRLKLLQGLCEVAKIEYRILPNNVVEVSDKVGGSQDGQYRYGYNTKTLNRKVDTSTMTTRISVFGLDGINVTYTSPAANTFGLIDAEPIRDERYTTKDVLLDIAKQSLQDYPLVSLEVDASETKHRTIGETVFLIYEPLKIDVKTRIMRRMLEYRAGELVVTSVTMGNHVPMTSTDLFVQQKLEYDENKKIQTSRFEQTNDRITLEVEEIEVGLEENKALLEITAKEIRTEVTQVDKRLSDRITTNSSKITQTASEIRSEVEKDIRFLNGRVDSAYSRITQTASEIRSEVNKEVKYLDGRIDTANSKITQTANSITSEVNREVRRLDSRVDSANSKITQTASQIRSEVGYELDRVDEKFVGVTSAISSIEQKADKIESTVTTVEQEMDGLERTVRNHSSSITQMSNEISMKVSAGDIASEINQTAQGVKIRASKIEMDGIVELSDSVELGRSSSSRTKAIKFDGTGAWIYSNGSNLTISSNYLDIDAYADALSPISNRRGGLALAPNGLWLGIQSDGSLRVSDGNQVRYYAPM